MKSLVPGHVDDADRLAARQRQPGEAEVDRHPARLLLGQPVGIDARQRSDESRLAVVDVAGGADDFHLYTTLLTAQGAEQATPAAATSGGKDQIDQQRQREGVGQHAQAAARASDEAGRQCWIASQTRRMTAATTAR